MNKKSLTALTASLAFSAMMALPSGAGHAVGNGGDYIRATFLQMGQAIVNHLQNSAKGQALVQKHGLDIQGLRDSLTIHKIKVVDEELVDNGGSVVDAIGAPGSIVLSKENWFEHFEKQRDIYYLVLHEMLRENGIDDDNYKISGALFPFDQAFAIESKLVDLVPLIDNELLENTIDLNTVSLAGTGCPKGEVTRLDFDAETNIFEINFKNYRAKATVAKKMDRQNCSMALPFQVPPGKKLVVAQQDLAGKINLSVGSNARISSEVFIAGMVKPALVREYRAATTPLAGRTLLRKTELLESNCGGAGVLRANTSAFINGSDSDSVKISALRLYLSLEECSP